MANLRPAPIFLTPPVVREMLGLGRAKNMARLEVVSLTDTGARCSTLRMRILRAMRDANPRNLSFVVPREVIAQQVRISIEALDEHIAALRACDCVHATRFRLTAKGFQKVAMADLAAREGGGRG